jgi:large subunit ribosomal protein L25
MAANAKLSAQPREDVGKGVARKLRAQGRVPAVIYGHGEETRKLTLDAHDLSRLFARVHVENTIIELSIEGENAGVKALVREVQKHAWRDDILHVDFYQIHAGEHVNVEIPIRLRGNAPGVKIGGIMQQTLNDLEIRCLPDQIPEVIYADVSALDIGDGIHVSDLDLPEGVEPLVDLDRTVCTVVPPTVSPTSEDEEAAEEEPASEEPEVIGRGHEDEEEE